jgi:repressor LexA
MSITETQQRILRLIAERIESEGMPPSQTEIARELGFKGVRAAQHHLEALERAGAIERIPGRARGIRVLQPVPAAQPDLPLASDAADWVPLVGRVSAGSPIGTDIDYDNRLLLDRSLFSPFPDYLLRVEGESMRDEGILDGDLIGVHRTAQARNGQIVVARVDEEITVKQLEIARTGIRLLPRNADYAPIDVAADQDFAIEGLYCGLVRPHR